MISWLIKKRKITILFFVMFFLIGVLTVIQLPQREIPEIDPPVAQVLTIYPGASAEQVEKTITNIIEESISSIQEVKQITSRSSHGISALNIELEDGINANQVWNRVRQNITDASSKFPVEVQSPIINDDLSMQGLATYQLLLEDESLLPLVNTQLERWTKKFSEIDQIANVSIQGAIEKEFLIELDPDSLRSNLLSPGQVVAAITNETRLIPPGDWTLDERKFRVQLDTFIRDYQFSDLAISKTAQGETIVLGDIAAITETFKPKEELIYHNGQLAVSLTFFLDNGASVTKAQRQLDNYINEFASELPNGVELVLLYTQADLVAELFRDLAIAFGLAIISVLLVCSLGLNISTAFSVAIAIPVSLSIGAIILPFIQVDLNQISLIAFIISLGVLVDDAIVVNENIDRHLQKGKTPFKAAVDGTKQVSVSVITSTLTVVFTFLPLVLLPGAAGAFIRPLPTVLISTIIASTIVALGLIPLYRVIRETRRIKSGNIGTNKSERKPAGLLGAFIEKLANWYGEVILKRVVRRPLLFTISGFLLGTIAYALIPFIPLEFFPDTNREEVFIEAILPEGVVISETDEEMKKVASWLEDQVEVRTVTTYVGANIPRLFGMTGSSQIGPNKANFLVFIDKDKTTTKEMVDLWNERLPKEFPEMMVTLSVIESGPPVGAPIAIQISGESLETLLELTNQVKAVLSSVEGVASISDDVGSQLPTLDIVPNRTAMDQWGITSREISESLRLLGDGIPLGQIEQQEQLLDMRMTYFQEGTRSLDQLESIYLPTREGEAISLATFVDVDSTFSIQTIPHRNNVRTITVRAYPGERTTDEILADSRKELDEIFVSETGYSLVIGGENSARSDVFIDIGKIFIIVLFLVLIVLAIQFYSLVIPFLILSTVYLAISGALFGLFITQTGLGFMSMMGAVSLAGIVVRNGIMLIEFFEQSRKLGMELVDAVIHVGKLRFRPIILTSVTSIAGLMPIALGNNPLFKPLGIAIVSGLFFSTILTLIIVPALYMLYAKRQKI